MAISRTCIPIIPLIRHSSLSPSLNFFSFSHLRPSFNKPSCLISCASLSTQQHSSTNFADQSSSFTFKPIRPTWRPICLYYTHGKCTLMEDPLHIWKFNHDCNVPFEGSLAKSDKLKSQHVDFLLVLDLEGKIEILEFPVMMINTKTLQVVDFFHRFVRPCNMTEKSINKYIEGKYGKLGVDRVWHDTATPFREVIQEFEAWLTHHQLWGKELGGPLHRAAFVTCGNWDIKTKIPQQCQVSGMKIPPYFMEWTNLKDIYLNFYNRRATGMRTMLNELNIPLLGSHHLGIDDTKNISSVVQHMLADGAVMQITARRKPNAGMVEFLFKNRIR